MLLYEFKTEEEEEIPKRKDGFSSDIFINADKIRTNQVIDNLLTNATKFTEEGTVSISITCNKGKNHNDIIIVRIKDNEEKFATRSDMGTGLGLFISKNIVEAHGGERITPTEKELPLFLVYLQKGIVNKFISSITIILHSRSQYLDHLKIVHYRSVEKEKFLATLRG